jgi:hypothetical protein
MNNTCANLYKVKKCAHTHYHHDADLHKNKILKILNLVEISGNSNIPKDVNVLCP